MIRILIKDPMFIGMRLDSFRVHESRFHAKSNAEWIEEPATRMW